jgi:hypothetical protein
MKGTLVNTPVGWAVNYNYSADKKNWEQLPLHPDFVEMLDTCFRSTFTQEVDFEIVDEYTNPELYIGVPLWEGNKYAKLIKPENDKS